MKTTARRTAFGLILWLGAGAANPYFDPAKPHHTPEGFRNLYPHAEKGSFWKWKFEQWRDGVPSAPAGGWNFPLLKPDVAFLKSNRSADTLTWIGHESFLVQLGGLNILADPHLTERASPLSFAGPRRVVPPALDFADLPHIDIVVVSHNHYDHMDKETLARLAAQAGGPPRYFVGLGLKRWFEALDIQTADEFDWWDSRVVQGLTFHFVPVQHWSRRTPWDANKTLWGGWLIESPNFRFFHAGDAGYSRDFADIRARFGPIDLAALPVGGYAPRWFMRIYHLDPDEAVTAHKDLGARFSVGMHWGTFTGLTDEPLDEPPKRLSEALKREGISSGNFFLMRHGETRLLERDGGNSLAIRRVGSGAPTLR
ncbi:MAG TPA: MBL fold metallo-hydrolase [Candidatus Binatia bacterium]|jgi:L-ascorbate metabolism protein UlaG (beta-lactamase superfamily)